MSWIAVMAFFQRVIFLVCLQATVSSPAMAATTTSDTAVEFGVVARRYAPHNAGRIPLRAGGFTISTSNEPPCERNVTMCTPALSARSDGGVVYDKHSEKS